MPLGRLETLTGLVCLRLDGSGVLDKDCQRLASLTRLTRLHLRDNEVSNAAVQMLSTLTALQVLDLSGTKATCPPPLSCFRELYLNSCQVLCAIAPLCRTCSLMQAVENNPCATYPRQRAQRTHSSPYHLECQTCSKGCSKREHKHGRHRLYPLRAQVGGDDALRVARSVRFPNLAVLHMQYSALDEPGVDLLSCMITDSARTLSDLDLEKARLAAAPSIQLPPSLRMLKLSGEQSVPL